MRERLVAFMMLVCGATTAWADAKQDCGNKSGDVAIVACTEAIRSNPSDAVLYLNRGGEYASKNELDLAIADFNKAIELDPQFAFAYNNRGIAYRTKGDDDRAIADYSKAIELDQVRQRLQWSRQCLLRQEG